MFLQISTKENMLWCLLLSATATTGLTRFLILGPVSHKSRNKGRSRARQKPKPRQISIPAATAAGWTKMSWICIYLYQQQRLSTSLTALAR
ncbi:hypothetical protein BKA67DRAFT_586094 [Truncatella angustata]|uniref:Uncharacterized protein n=1 Tax=Truncatella angustata TaxID=152316 RepID=A0A9P8RM65_9PEZI|nr:uncharacterized protein BKA67DRAFT_586094 [Truncatella angustata]KAH6645671.1 hypothetical protein BKA67DRAFT_586094 [Truncatella angustata]